jgi:hypothetical protein
VQSELLNVINNEILNSLRAYLLMGYDRKDSYENTTFFSRALQIENIRPVRQIIE